MIPTSGADRAGEHVVDRLVDYLSGSQSEEDDARVERHLLHCAECLAEYESLSDVALRVATTEPDEPDGGCSHPRLAG